MTAETKSTLLKTLVAIALMILGVWGFNMNNKTNSILGAILFIIGLVIMTVIYKSKWIDWWTW
ncbi:MAG TPA: hypothetical protein VNT20_15740 [Flavisolibacter sp.]|nr:hypothetical protein [Flavisolibacter sp.]